jgi:RNA polymerase sigma-70 factor (ECF subfamily)
MASIPSGNRAESQQGTRTSSSLLDCVRANEGDAWRRFVQLYSPLVYSWAKRCGLKKQDAADVMQEVFHAVARHVVRFKRAGSTGSFRAWLWTITRNKVRDHFRMLGALPVGGSEMHLQLQELPEQEPESWSQDGECSRVALVRRAAELVRNDFEPRTWQAFWRLAVEGQSAREIASALGMTGDAVYQAKARVLRRLRDELEGQIG